MISERMRNRNPLYILEEKEAAIFDDVSTEEWRPLNGFTRKELQRNAVQVFRQYLETKGTLLSQSTDLLPYYALPYVPNPKEHPIYRQLFTDAWRNSVEVKLGTLIDDVLFHNKKSSPYLVKLLSEERIQNDRKLRQLTSELADAEKRFSQSQRRFTRLQVDYQTLLSVSADLLDALESSLKGIKVDDDVMQRIYTRVMKSQSFNTKNSTNISIKDHLVQRASMDHTLTVVTRQNSSTRIKKTGAPLCDLNYAIIKTELPLLDDRKKCYLLQALRWRLTKSTLHEREYCLTAFVRQDLLDLTTISPTENDTMPQTPLLACLQSEHHRVREYTARFINALSSLCRGRAYLAQNIDVVKLLFTEVMKEHDESITRENLVGALQKMSLRRSMQTVMINLSVISWLTNLLERTDGLSDYTLEYAVALYMNLCLRTAGKRNCSLQSERILNVLIELLNGDNIDIVPYVNGALYSILAMPDIRRAAVTMGLQSILERFIKGEEVEMNRQFEFIIRRLRSNEPTPDEDSDDGMDDEDDEEDALALESDLDRQDMPAPDSRELSSSNNMDNCPRDPQLWVGEGLLEHRYAIQSVARSEANGDIDWCKPQNPRKNETRRSSNDVIETSVLCRPTTPGQMSQKIYGNDNRSNTPSEVGKRVQDSLIIDEFVNPICLSDSQVMFSSDTSKDSDITPKASLELDTNSEKYTEDVNIDTVLQQDPPKLTTVTTTRSVKPSKAFESISKIPRTPETTHSQYDTIESNVDKLHEDLLPGV